MALRFPSPTALARGALVLAAPLALLLTTGRDVWLRPDYAFVVLAVPAALALAARRAWVARPWQPGHPAVGRALAVVTWLVLAAAVLVGAPQGAALALVAGLAAVAWDLGGWPLLRETAPALALLAVCVPLPQRLDQSFLTGLENLSSRWGGYLLDLLGVAHVRSGHLFETTGWRIDVSPVYAGALSPFALAALVLALAGAAGRHLLRAAALAAAAVGLMLPAGSLCIALALWLNDLGVVAWDDRLVAAAVFLLAGALTLSVDQLLGIPGALRPRPYQAQPEGDEPEARPAVVRLASWPAALGFGCLLALQWAPAPSPGAPAPAPRPDWAFAARYEDWEKIEDAPGPGDPHPGVALAARYRSNRLKARLELIEGAAAGAGEPTADNERQGWVLRGREVFTVPAEGGPDQPYLRVSYEKPLDGFRTVWLAGVTGAGHWTALRPSPGTLDRVRERFGLGGRPADDGVVWWLRLTLDTYLVPSFAELKAAESLFLEARRQAAPRLGAGEDAR